MVRSIQRHHVELETQNEELRKAQLELQESHDRFSDLYDFSPVGYFTISHKGIIMEANLTGAAMVDLERHLLIGKPFSDFISRDDQDVFFLCTQKLLKEKTKQIVELKLKKKDGSLLHAQLECVAVWDNQGNVSQFRATVSDINKRKRAKKKIERGKKEWEVTFDAISDWICLIDLEQRIQRTNRSAEKVLGEPLTEVVGQKC